MHAPMSRARYVQENRMMRFEEAYEGWTGGRLTQAEAAMLLGRIMDPGLSWATSITPPLTTYKSKSPSPSMSLKTAPLTRPMFSSTAVLTAMST